MRPSTEPAAPPHDVPAGTDPVDAIDAPGHHRTDLAKESESYTHGHHESVLRSHRARTAANSAAFLLPHLDTGMRVLDVGCGPGTVTVDLAEQIEGLQVIGVDAAAGVLESARELADRHPAANVAFQQANAYELPFEDDSFDAVYAHQVLQHLSEPVLALREMRRVTRPGGVVAVRDADYAAMAWYPASAQLTEWNTLYHEVTRAYGFEPDAGRHLLAWFRSAGYELSGIIPTTSSWCYATPADRRWWGDLWAQRCTESNFAVQAKESALADEVGLEQIAQGWQEWAASEDGWFAILHAEIIARA